MRHASPIPLAALSASLIIACTGGERRTPAADSVPAAAAPAPVADTTAPAVTDTAAPPKAPPPAPTDTASKPTPAAARPPAQPVPAKAEPAKAEPPKPEPPAPTQEAQKPAADPYHPAPRDTVDGDTYNGWKQYELNCARCHGEYGVGTSFAPALVVSLKDDGTIPTQELFITTVCAGRPEKGMPGWCALGLEMDKIQRIYKYLKSRADGHISAGRPAVRS